MFGVGRMISMATSTWKPWQLYALAGAMVAAGVALALAGIDRGLLVAVVGVLMAARVMRRRASRRARATLPSSPQPESRS